MPRVSAAHEQAVRQRIVDASIRVFSELGYRRATIQDVVRESGLSVGAVYTHFRSKEELFLVACACEAEQQAGELRVRLAELGSLVDRLRVAIDWSIDKAVDESGGNVLLHAWTSAAESAELRQLLRDRRTEMVAFSRLVLQEAVSSGELPAWLDVEGLAAAFVTLIDGMTLRSAEGAGMSRQEAREEAYALLELLLAAPPEVPAGVQRLRADALPAASSPRNRPR